MWRTQVPAILAAACLMVTGCTGLSYKRGAGSGEFDGDHDICNARNGDNAQYEKCMNERGWVVQKFDAPGPLATIIPNGGEHISTLDRTTPEKEQASVAKQLPQNALDVYPIGSWWKMGGKPEELQSATDACLEKLGEAHRPPSGRRVATRGLLLCLHDQGWHGLPER